MIRPWSKLSANMRAALLASKVELLALLASEQRPCKLTRAEGDAAHAGPWDDAAIARLQARVHRLLRLGFNEADADDLALIDGKWFAVSWLRPWCSHVDAVRLAIK